MKKLLILPAIALCMGLSMANVQAKENIGLSSSLPCTISVIDHPGINNGNPKSPIPPIPDDFVVKDPASGQTDCAVCYSGGDSTISADECLAACGFDGGKSQGNLIIKGQINPAYNDALEALCCAAMYPEGIKAGAKNCSTGCFVTGSGGKRTDLIVNPGTQACKHLAPQYNPFITKFPPAKPMLIENPIPPANPVPPAVPNPPADKPFATEALQPLGHTEPVKRLRD